jgi:hypothetical protein
MTNVLQGHLIQADVILDSDQGIEFVFKGRHTTAPLLIVTEHVSYHPIAQADGRVGITGRGDGLSDRPFVYPEIVLPMECPCQYTNPKHSTILWPLCRAVSAVVHRASATANFSSDASWREWQCALPFSRGKDGNSEKLYHIAGCQVVRVQSKNIVARICFIFQTQSSPTHRNPCWKRGH